MRFRAPVTIDDLCRGCCVVMVDWLCGFKHAPNNQNKKNDLEFGMNENYTWYNDCGLRRRNKGLYVAACAPACLRVRARACV
jgi:hypothetical protein